MLQPEMSRLVRNGYPTWKQACQFLGPWVEIQMSSGPQGCTCQPALGVLHPCLQKLLLPWT